MHEFESKLQQLLQSKDAQNNHLAVLLARSCMGLNTAEALCKLLPDVKLMKSAQHEEVVARYEVANLSVVYHLSSAYIPYMDSDISVTRYVQQKTNRDVALIDSLSGFIEYEHESLDAYKVFIQDDFKAISKQLCDYLDL